MIHTIKGNIEMHGTTNELLSDLADIVKAMRRSYIGRGYIQSAVDIGLDCDDEPDLPRRPYKVGEKKVLTDALRGLLEFLED
jgi:hypothetical protein